MASSAKKVIAPATALVVAGGARLGQGRHGAVYDVCAEDNDTLCAKMSSVNPTKIVLYTVDGETTLKTPEHIGAFVTYLHSQHATIAKIFMPVQSFFNKSLQRKLDDELESNRIVAKLLGTQVGKYTTLAPLSGFNDIPVLGARIEGKDVLYVVFGSKCNPKYEIKNLDFVKDILECVVELQTRDYMHNDIKLDNIVLCDNRYKLVDWGAGTPMDFDRKRHGAIHMISPMRYYCWGYPPALCHTILKTRTQMMEPALSRSDMFKEQYERLVEEFQDVVYTGPPREKMFNVYKYSFDVFNLGMTLMHAVFHSKLSYATYKPVIEALTSLTKPLDAKSALDFVRFRH